MRLEAGLAVIILAFSALLAPMVAAADRNLSYPVKKSGAHSRQFTSEIDFRGGVVDRSDSDLEIVRTFKSEGHTIRFLTPESDIYALESMWRLPEAQIASALEKYFWAPLKWGSASISTKFATQPPRFHVDVVLLNANTTYVRKFNRSIDSPDFAIVVAARLPDPEDPDNQLLNATLFPAGAALHESVHLMETYGPPYVFKAQDKTSAEAAAYAFSACAQIVTGALPRVMIAGGIPMAQETALRYHGAPSKTVLRDAQRQLRDAVGKLDPGSRGSIIAGLALFEAAGGQEQFSTDLESAAFEQFCHGTLDARVDWVKQRPCQTDEYREFCLPLTAK